MRNTISETVEKLGLALPSATTTWMLTKKRNFHIHILYTSYGEIIETDLPQWKSFAEQNLLFCVRQNKLTKIIFATDPEDEEL